MLFSINGLWTFEWLEGAKVEPRCWFPKWQFAINKEQGANSVPLYNKVSVQNGGDKRLAVKGCLYSLDSQLGLRCGWPAGRPPHLLAAQVVSKFPAGRRIAIQVVWYGAIADIEHTVRSDARFIEMLGLPRSLGLPIVEVFARLRTGETPVFCEARASGMP